ncbi:MAG: tetratricopeptide repeat protein [Cellvibrionaceae bacterium]
MNTQLNFAENNKSSIYIVMVYLITSFLSNVTLGASSTNTIEKNDISNALNEGIYRFEKGEYSEANALFSSAIQQQPSNAKAFQFLGMSQYKLQDNKKAIQSLQKSIEIHPDTAESHYALGISYLARTGDVSVLKIRKTLKKAITHLNKAIEINPSHSRANFYLIQVLINAPSIMGGDEDKGLTLNSQLKTIAPLQHMVVNSTIAIKNEDYEEAEKILLDADKKFPNKTMIAYSLGELYLRLEQYSQALTYGKNFLAGPKLWDETSNNSGHYLLARAYKGLGNKSESQKHYALVLKNTNSKRMKKQIKRELDELDGKVLPADPEETSEELTEEQLNDPDFLKSLSKEETS